MVSSACEYCGKISSVFPSQAKTKRFCSRRCRYDWQSSRPERSPRWKGGRWKTDHGYIALSTRMKRRMVYEHRAIMAVLLRRPLRSDEVVHHINGNRADNSPSNLLLTSRGQHISGHMLTLWNDPVKRKRRSERIKASWNDPDKKAQRVATMRIRALGRRRGKVIECPICSARRYRNPAKLRRPSTDLCRSCYRHTSRKPTSNHD